MENNMLLAQDTEKPEMPWACDICSHNQALWVCHLNLSHKFKTIYAIWFYLLGQKFGVKQICCWTLVKITSWIQNKGRKAIAHKRLLQPDPNSASCFLNECSGSTTCFPAVAEGDTLECVKWLLLEMVLGKPCTLSANRQGDWNGT